MRITWMANAMQRWQVILLTMGMAMVTEGCAETKVGGMTALQAFPNQVSAEWVTAVEQDDYARADRLLAQGAQVNLVGAQGITPLLWVMSAKRWDGKRLEYMLKAGADPNYIAPTNKVSPMYGAAGSDRPDILRLLLKYHGNPNLPAPDIVTGEARISFTAALQGRLENIEILLQHGLDINWQDANGETLAHTAVAANRYDIVVYCLDHGMTSGLDILARETIHTPLSDNSEMVPWKEKVIAMLKARGADFEYKK